MIKGLLTFGLTRRPIVLLILMMFAGGGAIAFLRLNIEAYPNPAPVILEITAQTAGLSAEEMGGAADLKPGARFTVLAATKISEPLDETTAREAFRLAAAKLPLLTKFVVRQVGQ